jgi:hypothetical protein
LLFENVKKSSGCGNESIEICIYDAGQGNVTPGNREAADRVARCIFMYNDIQFGADQRKIRHNIVLRQPWQEPPTFGASQK